MHFNRGQKFGVLSHRLTPADHKDPYRFDLAIHGIVKLIIQIPCFNEADSIAAGLATLPKSIAGISLFEILVVEDGCADDTDALAQRPGVTPIERHHTNRGLAAAFRTGLDRALAEGADIIVNTDADNQYGAPTSPRWSPRSLAERRTW